MNWLKLIVVVTVGEASGVGRGDNQRHNRVAEIDLAHIQESFNSCAELLACNHCATAGCLACQATVTSTHFNALTSVPGQSIRVRCT